MSTLHDGHVSGTSGYVTGKCGRCDKIMCNTMIDEEYTTRFVEFFIYVPYLKDEKENIQRFISGFPLSFKDYI